MTVTPTDIGFQFLSRSLQISICLHVRRENLFINVSISIDTVQVPVLKMSDSELRHRHKINCTVLYCIVFGFVIVKLLTDDLAMAAENSLRNKNQRHKIKQG